MEHEMPARQRVPKILEVENMKRVKSFIALLLVLCTVAGMFSMLAPMASAATGAGKRAASNTGSSAAYRTAHR